MSNKHGEHGKFLNNTEQKTRLLGHFSSRLQTPSPQFWAENSNVISKSVIKELNFVEPATEDQQLRHSNCQIKPKLQNCKKNKKNPNLKSV